ncbi:MAG: RecX family transcriptional regulator [Bacteroidaceae bacterium]|nr:RecX family transcriptional regulator [Bacteroidaceae bacterium]
MQKRPISSKKTGEQEALQYASALCARRECCAGEIREKLAARGVEAGARERIVERLTDEGYIDEDRFCRAYARDKLRYNHWGRVKIGQMLRLLGLPSTAREAALRQLPADEYEAVLRRVAESKRQSIRGGSAYERWGKLVRFLLGRGFEREAIDRVLADMGEENEE